MHCIHPGRRCARMGCAPPPATEYLSWSILFIFIFKSVNVRLSLCVGTRGVWRYSFTLRPALLPEERKTGTALPMTDVVVKRRNTASRLVIRHVSDYRHVMCYICQLYGLLQILTICKMLRVAFVGLNEI